MMEVKPRCWWMLLLIAILVLEGSTDACLENERNALLHLKPFFNDFNDLRTWVEVESGNSNSSSYSDCCEWNRVECNSTTKHVISLALNATRNQRDPFYLNASLFLPFEWLKSLCLPGNSIAGFVENEGSGRQLRLTHLEQLDLSNNLFNNSVFSSLTQLSNLKFLDIGRNKLQGSIDIRKGWCELRNLKELYMNGNALQGMLPSCLGNFTSLLVLDMSENQFTGNLTPLANLSSLVHLSLSKNNLQVPTSFSPLTNLTHLKVLFFDQNKLVMEPSVGFHDSLPKFQLNFLSLFNCTTNKQLMKEPLQFLYHQHDLRYVDLSYNNLSCSVPTWLLQNNPNLEALRLLGNSFTGPFLLPPLPNLNLTIFELSDSKIQSQIPANVCSALPFVERLVLSGNEFKGSLPSCLGGLRFLYFLDLSNNQLSGVIPKELAKSRSLEVLKLSNNNLSGKIVPEIFTSSLELQSLFLDRNNFVGELPDIDISTHDVLFYFDQFDLSNNNLSGKLPRWIWNLPNLDILALSNNHFEGSISIELCNLDELRILDFSHNNLSGSMPSCFNPRSIAHVHLNGNKLSGPLMGALPNSSSLVTLDLGGNNFIGSIPEWIDKFSSLSVLILKDNLLDGGIPNQLCKLDSLSILDLSRNKFSGSIPSCLGDLTLPPSFHKSVTYFLSNSAAVNVKYLWKLTGVELRMLETWFYRGLTMENSIDFTTKSGSYSYKGNILNYMSGIDLSCNKLSGHIPSELGNLRGIHALNLSHNNLTQVIPWSFSKLKQIESLDLSYNNLSGKIPVQLVELNSLEVFSVAHNNLSGTTPERKAQFGTFEESSYEGNPLLCGPPLHNNCTHTGSQPTVPTASDAEEDDSLLDTYVFGVTFLACYVVVLLAIFVVLYINPYWRRRWFFFIEDFIDYCRHSTVGTFLRIFRRKVRI